MQKFLSPVRRAVDEYQMIAPGDRIAVGISGGKDSLALLAALSKLRTFYPNPFELEAVTVSMGLEPFDLTHVRAFCEGLGVRFTEKKTQIAEIIFDIRKEQNPCSLCAKMRRGALHDTAVDLGCNKVALGHHFDDVIETFFLCLFYESRVSCFSPVTYLSRKDITMIRPMIYVPEYEVRRMAASLSLPVVKSPCPADGCTKRQEVKELIASLEKQYKGLKGRLFHAVKTSGISGWDTPVINEGEGLK